MTKPPTPTNDKTPEGVAHIREQIADGLDQAKAGELIDGDEAMQRLHKRIMDHADEEAA